MADPQLHIPEENSSVDASDEERSQARMKRSRLLHVPPSKRKQYKESGFHKSLRLCLHAIRDAVLHHRWQEAAEYLEAYTQAMEDTTSSSQTLACEIIWRLGIEVLQHHPNANQEHFTVLYERMKNSGVKHYAKVCLEHAFHLLLRGHFQDAKQQLLLAMSWRYGKQSAQQSVELTLIQAYCGFLDYLVWSEKRSSLFDTEDHGTNREIHSFFRQASVTLQEVIKQPGVWDPYVCACVDMLEFYNTEEEAVQLLQNYAYNKDYPSNPNAHVYLYTHQKRHNASTEQLRSTLKGLHSLVPSHELMLEYCDLLIKSEEQKDLHLALSIVLNLLEHSSWKSDVRAWRRLLTLLTYHKKDLKPLVLEEMKERKELWMKLHFKAFHCRKDSKQSATLLQLKAKASNLLGVYSRHYSMVYGQEGKKKEKKLKTKS